MRGGTIRYPPSVYRVKHRSCIDHSCLQSDEVDSMFCSFILSREGKEERRVYHPKDIKILDGGVRSLFERVN